LTPSQEGCQAKFTDQSRAERGCWENIQNEITGISIGYRGESLVMMKGAKGKTL
jgi:hypothetical protein